MSEENVEAVRRWVAAINDGDADALLRLADADVDYMPYLAAVSGSEGGYQGHDGLRQYVRDLTEAWSAYEVEIHRLRDLGADVLMQGRLWARGKASGIEVDAEMAWLHSFREGTGSGRYVRLRFYPTAADALKAAGHSE